MRRRDNGPATSMMSPLKDIRSDYVEYPKPKLDLYLART
jgi:hypothetical protein